MRTASSAERANNLGASSIASSSVQGRVRMDAKASIPKSKLRRTPLPMVPASAMTGFPVFFGAGSYFSRNFSERRLTIETTFRRYDQVGFLDKATEVQILHNNLVTWMKLSAKKSEYCGAKSTPEHRLYRSPRSFGWLMHRSPMLNPEFRPVQA